jgi:hypothetical protein
MVWNSSAAIKCLAALQCLCQHCISHDRKQSYSIPKYEGCTCPPSLYGNIVHPLHLNNAMQVTCSHQDFGSVLKNQSYYIKLLTDLLNYSAPHDAVVKQLARTLYVHTSYALRGYTQP